MGFGISWWPLMVYTWLTSFLIFSVCMRRERERERESGTQNYDIVNDITDMIVNDVIAIQI